MDRLHSPRVVIQAGPNGAGKSTTSQRIVRDVFGVRHYVNADTLARGLSAFAYDEVAVSAGRIMLEWMRELVRDRQIFGFETTLAARSYASWISELRADGYECHLVFVSLRDPDLAVSRVADRVRRGGHHIPEETVRRRFTAGLKNLFSLYIPLATSWMVLDNSSKRLPARLVALGGDGRGTYVERQKDWDRLVKDYGS